MTSCTGQGGTGTQYTYAQLEGLWINAGGSAAVAPVAAAIALAESGGCSAALNPTDNGGTQTSWGLWQISNGTHNQPVANILTPAVNAQQAVAKYQAAGDSFSPWGTYDSGAYEAFLNGSTTPDTNVPNAGTASSASSASSTGSQCQCLWGFGGVSIPVVGSTGSFCIVSQCQARAIIGGMCIAAGGLGLLTGALILAAAGFRGSGAGKAAADAAETVAPVAATAGLAARVTGAGAANAGRRAGRRRRRAAPPAAAAAPASATSTRAINPPRPQPSQEEVRAQLRARADQISTRQEAS